MKDYFFDNPHDWLDELIPDLIDEILKASVLDAGFIYAPYIPLYTAPPTVDPADFTVRKGIRSRRIVNAQNFKVVPLGKIDEPTDMSKYEDPPRRVVKRDAVLKAIESFTSRRPTETPSAFTSIPKRLQSILIDRSLRSLTDAGILNYDKEQKGWWRPEVLDALGALPDGSTAEDERPTLGPSGSGTQSP